MLLRGSATSSGEAQNACPGFCEEGGHLFATAIPEERFQVGPISVLALFTNWYEIVKLACSSFWEEGSYLLAIANQSMATSGVICVQLCI